MAISLTVQCTLLAEFPSLGSVCPWCAECTSLSGDNSWCWKDGSQSPLPWSGPQDGLFPVCALQGQKWLHPPFFRTHPCSASQCFRLHPVWPMYFLGQPLHGTQYTTLFCSSMGTKFFGCTSMCQRVLSGRNTTWMSKGARIHLTASETPLMYGKVRVVLGLWSSLSFLLLGHEYKCTKLEGYPFCCKASTIFFSSSTCSTPDLLIFRRCAHSIFNQLILSYFLPLETQVIALVHQCMYVMLCIWTLVSPCLLCAFPSGGEGGCKVCLSSCLCWCDNMTPCLYAMCMWVYIHSVYGHGPSEMHIWA